MKENPNADELLAQLPSIFSQMQAVATGLRELLHSAQCRVNLLELADAVNRTEINALRGRLDRLRAESDAATEKLARVESAQFARAEALSRLLNTTSTDAQMQEAARRLGEELGCPDLAQRLLDLRRVERSMAEESDDDLNDRLRRALKAMHQAREAVSIEGLTVTVHGHRVTVRGPLHLRMVAIERVTTAAQAHDWEREGVVFVFLAEGT